MTLASVWSPSPAAAQSLDRDQFVHSTSEVLEQFCGDLTVRLNQTVHGAFLLTSHGNDGLGYGMETVHGSSSFTNLANGLTFTQVFNFVEKDLTVVHNGDGTLTVLVLAAGSNKVYGSDGRLLFNDPGQVRYELLISDGGTPADPADDDFLELLGFVKGSTGRNDLQDRDFCDDIHEFIG